MKKFYAIALSLVGMLLCFAGCGPLKESLIPKELGVHEGLWLYRGTERMRTDRSEREPLLGDVVLDEETYTVEDYKVKTYLYCTDEKAAFFVLTVEVGDYLYCYNYAEKRGVQLSEACKSGGEHPSRGYLCASGLHSSESYVCFESIDEMGKTVTSLFLRDGTPVCEGMRNFEFLQDILWKYERGESGRLQLTWWKDGELRSVETALWTYDTGNFFYDGECFYEFSGQGVSVNTNTGETALLTYEGTKSNWRDFYGTAYFLTYGKQELCTNKYHSVIHNQYIYSSCRLYACVGGEAKLLYTFDESLDMVFYGYGNYKEGMIPLAHQYSAVERNAGFTQVNGFWKREKPFEYTEHREYYFDAVKGELKKGSAPEIRQEREELVCGDYTFWIDYKTYPDGFYTGHCQYLYREYQGKVEIMQYAFDRPLHANPFYNDICEF